MPMEAIDGQLLVIVCNLKPVKMRGVTSQAMVLCANTPEAVEFVRPPAGATPGTPVYFEGFEDQAATDQPLNPKKKVFESIQPLLKTDDQRQAAYFGTDGRVRLLRTKEGVCQADTLVGAAIR
ncbi:aminoacyl tRNA synthase complex-interacting multifunctional protein 1-like protein [Caulochytrium protostelioides]|uniref:Aminoacyl tRNA synthase complex-interacting multifunctional protein 1-like protein n=2 Tax=Caulochytrium protostelioides TaxID=1555241 RepID=A0A4P9WSV1_9FUNG|nr:aminoacyl tRNA synthase complex-interacting multifunctional protein 1-like protein [Caulochytrium protostelioides]